MKKHLLLCLLFSMFVFLTADAKKTTTWSKTVHVATAGTLSNLLTSTEKISVTELTVTGKLNGTDIIVLQDMANSAMKVLDFSGADIVKGGSGYYTFTTPAGSTTYYTENNVVGKYMFKECEALQKVTLPRNATKIESGAFWYSSLRSMTIGSKVTSITAGLSAGTPLEEIILDGNTLFILQDGILYDKAKTTVYKALCTITGDIVLPGSVNVIKNSSFSESQIRSIVIPEGVEKIETAVFSECSNLETVKFPTSLTEVGYFSFSRCDNLKNVDLSDTKVTYIDGNAFYMCNSVKEVQLPSTLKKISGSAFTSTVLRKVSCDATTPPSIEEGTYQTFNYAQIANKCTLYINKKSESAYKKATGWKNFFNINDIGHYADICNSDDLQDFINRMANNGDKGTEDNPKEVPVSSDGLNIDNDINMEDDLQLFINGTGIGTTERLVVKFTYGVINNNENSGWRFGNVVFSDGNTSEGQNVKAYANRTIMTKVKGFINSGKLTFANCELSKGDYRLENNSSGVCVFRENSKVNGPVAFINNGSVYLDGTCSVDNIHNKHDGRIYFMDAPKTNVKITIENIADIDAEHPIIMGAYGYVLKNDDMELVTFDLPEGYEWYYDSTQHAIFVISANSVTMTEACSPQIKDSFNINGQNIGMSPKGINIQRMTDGTTRKIIIK